MDDEVPFRVLPAKPNRFRELQKQHLEACSPQEDFSFGDHSLATEILSAQHKVYNADEVADAQKHLMTTQRLQLKVLLQKFTRLFSGKLGLYPHEKIHLEIDKDAKPSYKRHYPVADAHRKVFKEELDRLVAIGVLKKVGRSEWASSSFVIPKKDGTVRWITDLRELNKVIKRKIYPLRRIHDILRRRNGDKFFTKLDVSMQCCAFKLDEASSELCTVSTPFGNYRHLRMPMGCCQSSDVSQQIMESLMDDIDSTEVCVNDCGVFHKSWESHLDDLYKVLK